MSNPLDKWLQQIWNHHHAAGQKLFCFFSDPDLLFDHIFNGMSQFCLWILMPRYATLVSSDISYLPFPPLSSDRCPLAETDSLNVGTVNCRNSAEPFLNDVKPRRGCDIVAFIAFVSPLLASLHLYSLVLFQLLPFFIPATNEWPLHDVTTLIHNKRNFSSLWNANMIKRRVEASYQSAPS